MSVDSSLGGGGFQVKYLGSVSFRRKKRRPLKGIVSLQRPLLELYTGARRRGESHRSVHPLALAQRLEVCDYGLVVAEEAGGRGETVVTKVITPLSNVVLWAAVRFHAKVIKKRVFGAAFVPLACSDGVLDPKSYACLSSKQRFLVSLTHPSVFACIFRSVSQPSTYECHAFVCATAEDAVAVAGMASRRGDGPVVPHLRRRPPASLDSGTDYYTPSDVTPASRDEEDRVYAFRESGGHFRTDTEEESNSYASVLHKASSPSLGQRRYVVRPAPQLGRPRKQFLNHREARAQIGRCGELWNPPRKPPPPEPKEEPPSRLVYERSGERIHRSSADEEEPRFKTTSTMTEDQLPPPTEVLAETIDLSSESSSSSAGWQPLLPAAAPEEPLVKYTYFGYETYARPPIAMPQQQPAAKHHQRKKDSSSASTIKGNGTGKVTINVSYRPDSRASSTSSMPRGVRSFHKNGHVRNWSSLSHTSASSSSSYRGGSKTLPQRAPQQKVIRWSSEDRLPRRQSGFFWSLKRISIQSLTKAKHKTGKLFSSMKTRLMGTKRSSADGSEDSAYDTSEVCLSPSGRQQQPAPPAPPAKGARRQQSWSFHDLREVERPVRRRKHHRRSRRKVGRSSSSSDSGVEARSDHSGRKSTSDPGRLNATRTEVKHGLTRKWSHTNIQDELGYIP